jgi:DNA-binding transcriptional ArsR family regulator
VRDIQKVITALASPIRREILALIWDREVAAGEIAARLDSDPVPLREALGAVYARSVGRWQRDLTPAQVEDVEREAGALLRELGY